MLAQNKPQNEKTTKAVVKVLFGITAFITGTLFVHLQIEGVTALTAPLYIATFWSVLALLGALYVFVLKQSQRRRQSPL